MKLHRLVVAALTVTLAVGALARAGYAQTFEEIRAAAAKEGTLVLWGVAPREDTVGIMVAAFNKRFGMNIKLQRVNIDGRNIPTRLQAEKAAGKITADFGAVNDRNVPTLLKAGLLEKVDWEGTFGGVLDRDLLHKAATSLFTEAHGYGLEFRHLIYGVVYNTNLVKAADAPKTWEDITNPKWKKRFVADPELLPVTYLAPVLGMDKTIDLGKRIIANEPIWADGAVQGVRKVATGEAAFGLTGFSSAVDQKNAGAPLEIVFLEPVALVPQQLMFVVKGAPHPNLTKMFVAWLCTEGMETTAMVDDGSMRARPGAIGPLGEYFTKNKLEPRFATTEAEFDQFETLRQLFLDTMRGRR